MILNITTERVHLLIFECYALDNKTSDGLF